MASSDFDSLHRRASDALFALGEEVGAVDAPYVVLWEALLSEIPKRSKNDWRGTLEDQFPAKVPTVYAISVDPSVDPQQVWQLLNGAKADGHHGRAYPRIRPCDDSCHLYVGTSKDPIKRFLEHLGFGSKSTYALQMAYWCGELSGALRIEAAFYNSVSSEVLCQLEDRLWMEKSPMFGRRGLVG